MAQTIKQGRPHGDRAPTEVRETVQRMLEEIEAGGEAAVRRYSRELDGWDPESFRIGDGEIDRLCEHVPDGLRRQIDFAAEQIGGFARAQRDTLLDLEVELHPGVLVGHRHVPVGAVGCYIPGGRYQLVSSALMSIVVAKVAGVQRVVAMTPVTGGRGPNPATVYAARTAGVDELYALGGVQALAALAFGSLPGVPAVSMIVGAGNAYVAEAKRQLFGIVGIDLLAGPTETLIIADETARPEVVAIDLLAQAEHGPTSPSVLVTTARELGEAVAAEVGRLLAGDWPTPDVAAESWRDLGAITVAADAEEAVAIADEFAPEHLQLQVADPGWYHDRLSNYGSLFIGEETTVSFGDKASGPNHTLPTQGAARYTGGLWVGKFLKTLTYQRLTSAGSAAIAVPAREISTAEGMHGHALSADVRLRLEGFPRLPNV